MILNEEQILERLLHPDPEKRVVITPLIRPEEQFGPSSIDLRMGTDFQVLRRTNITNLDPMRDPDDLYRDMHKHMEHVKIKPTEPFILHPGEFALASTLEFVRLPLDIAARLEGRSTWGRLGLQVHATAGFIDPGFAGAITYELSNVSNIPLTLYPGIRVSQLCLFESKTTRLPYNKKQFTKYSGQATTFSSAFFKDPEYARIRDAKEAFQR